MKRNSLIAWAIFGVLLLCVIFQLYAHETPLEKAARILEDRKGNLRDAIADLDRVVPTMDNAEQNWINNEEDITENRIDYASADLWGLGGAVLKQVMDMQDRAEIAVSLGAAIQSVQTAKSDAHTAERVRNTAWDNYVRLADDNRVSSLERNSKGPNVPNVTYPNISVSCPDCPESWSGSGIGGISGHITSCSVKGHTNQSGELVSDALPHFSCQSCPLAHQHYTFACRGECGDLSPEPTGENYHDHGYFCTEKTGLLSTCGRTAYTCKTPDCSNDGNHLIDGACDRHKVKKSDTSAIANHRRINQSCPGTYTYPSGTTIGCILYLTYECDRHSIHDFDPGSGTNPPPESLSSDETPNCSGCTSHCSSPCSCSESGTCNGTVAAPPPPPTPTPPATVSCGRSACTVSVSSANEHRLGPCGESTCGATSWSCGPYANWWQQQHRLRTCRRATCRQTWRNCSGGKPATCLANSNWRCQAE